ALVEVGKNIRNAVEKKEWRFSELQSTLLHRKVTYHELLAKGKGETVRDRLKESLEQTDEPTNRNRIEGCTSLG
ncbi:hypothetical protein WDW89_24610, partial [Deltaproteobacteria bacterium TL4]